MITVSRYEPATDVSMTFHKLRDMRVLDASRAVSCHE